MQVRPSLRSPNGPPRRVEMAGGAGFICKGTPRRIGSLDVAPVVEHVGATPGEVCRRIHEPHLYGQSTPQPS